MFERCQIRGIEFAPARFCAPLAGYTHSAFRRLVAELGGCGAFWTEMLAARQILSEDFRKSPWLRTRSVEGQVVFQLMTRASDPFDRILGRLVDHGVQAVDLNLACDALAIRAQESGSALFDNLPALRQVLESARSRWPGLLTVKIRLGSRRHGWEEALVERLRLIQATGIDAVVFHPRFFEDKFRRRARHDLLPWIASVVQIPIIANGDLTAPPHPPALAESLKHASAIMIGRMAIACPWVFAHWSGDSPIDYARIWDRMFHYIMEDFPPPVALRRIQMFTKYFAANFLFGHRFRCEVANADSLETVRFRAEAFLSGAPATVPPAVGGL